MLFSNQKNVLLRFLLSFFLAMVMNIARSFIFVKADIAGLGRVSSDAGKTAALFPRNRPTGPTRQTRPTNAKKRTESILRGKEFAYFSPMNFAALL